MFRHRFIVDDLDAAIGRNEFAVNGALHEDRAGVSWEIDFRACSAITAAMRDKVLADIQRCREWVEKLPLAEKEKA